MDRLYTADHEWVDVHENIATVGITDRAQSLLGDLVFVQLPTLEQAVHRGDAVGVVESVKSTSDIYAPLTGTVVAVNATVVGDPALVNASPFEAGWLFRLQMAEPAELSELLDESAYHGLPA